MERILFLSSQFLLHLTASLGLCPLTLLPDHVCLPQLHYEELDYDEEDEDEEGHKREQQDAAFLPGQSYILRICFCKENEWILGSSFFFPLRNMYNTFMLIVRAKRQLDEDVGQSLLLMVKST